MFVNSEQTLITILRQKHMFFRLMDYAQSTALNHALEFTISEYERLLDYIAQQKNETETRRLFETLSLENLERNGLLSYIDRRSGRLRLQDFVLDMLRHLDSTRLRELSSAELNQLMRQLEECYRQVRNPSIIWNDQQDAFIELLDSVYDTLQHVSSQLRSNVRALKGQAERLASLVDEDHFSDLSQTHQIRLALEAILKIHERHVIPTLQFLDPHLDIKRTTTELFGDSAPMALVRNIIDHFIQHKRHEHVTRLQRIQWQILTMGREVSEIAQSLDTYVKYAAAERKRYNQIEQLYSNLLSATQEKHTGNLRDYLLKPTDSVFQPMTFLGGLKHFARAYAANLNWPDSTGTSALGEILRVRLAKQKSPRDYPRHRPPAPLSTAEIKKRKHIEKLAVAMQSYPSHLPIGDIHLSVHQHLVNTLENYTLHDLAEAFAFLKYEATPALPFRWREIHFKHQRLRYRQRQSLILTLPSPI